MLKIILCTGVPASGKSTWAKEEVAKSPGKTTRINRDDLRNMMSNYHFSDSNEKLVTSAKTFMIQQALRYGRDIIIDETNLSSRNFNDICKLVRNMNIDCLVEEKLFFIELDEAILRDSKREGSGRVGEDVIRKFWKKSGGTEFKHRKPRTEIINKINSNNGPITPMVQDESKPRAVIFDNDGTISLIHPNRSPYDASTCDLDAPHLHVIECMRLYYNAGYKILFVSGREDKYRAPTERFYKQHFPEVKYELFMRPTGDKRKDVIIKEEIFNNHIKNEYYVAGWFDDRLQVSKWVHEIGLPLFRVNNPEATF
jgi:predicted kinase